jgi:hypothetical protein
MQASLARWAVVTSCLLGSLGCQSAKPSWWPGQKPVYSSSSSTPPPAVQQQQQQQYAQQQQAPGYDPASYAQNGAGAATGGYPPNAYQIGNNNPQDPYGMSGMQGAAAGNAYNHGYSQTQQPNVGAYPEQYANGANPYAQSGGSMGGLADQQGATGYQQAQGYQQPAANPYGSTGAAAGYNMRTADARTAGAPGYQTGGAYDTTNYGGAPATDPGQYNPTAASGQTPAMPSEQSYPANNNWQPGNTGYNPPGTTPYQVPGGAYGNDPNAAGQTDPGYRPGSTKDYAPSGTGAATTGGYGQPTTSAGAAAGVYNSGAGYSNAPASPNVDRYGRPIQQATNGYGDPTLQR